MLNINDLEIRQRRYKLKAYTPFITIFISLVIISISAIFLFNYSSILTLESKTIQNHDEEIIVKNKEIIENIQAINNKVDINNTNVKEINATKENIIIVQKQEENVTVIDSQALKILPSMNFIKNLQPSAPMYHENNNIKKIQTTKKQMPVKEKKPELTLNKQSSLNIKRRNDNSDIQHVINRFQVNNNPALSLFIAKKYYQLGEYEKAYNYALITNNLNNDIEDSWIIFAKSLVKLKKRDMAVETLKKYVDYSHSSQAKVLLDEILSEKFK